MIFLGVNICQFRYNSNKFLYKLITLPVSCTSGKCKQFQKFLVSTLILHLIFFNRFGVFMVCLHTVLVQIESEQRHELFPFLVIRRGQVLLVKHVHRLFDSLSVKDILFITTIIFGLVFMNIRMQLIACK